MTLCAKCKEHKEDNLFCKDKRRKNGLAVWCKKCASIASVAYRKANKEKLKVVAKRWRANNLDRYTKYQWKYKLKRFYKIGLEEYSELVLSQGGVCAGCNQKKPLCVDHDHSNGKVRGLLCLPCNSCLGFVGDDVDTLTRLSNYIKRYRS